MPGFRYQCPLCSYEATNTASIREHRKTKHEGIVSKICFAPMDSSFLFFAAHFRELCYFIVLQILTIAEGGWGSQYLYRNSRLTVFSLVLISHVLFILYFQINCLGHLTMYSSSYRQLIPEKYSNSHLYHKVVILQEKFNGLFWRFILRRCSVSMYALHI